MRGPAKNQPRRGQAIAATPLLRAAAAGLAGDPANEAAEGPTVARRHSRRGFAGPEGPARSGGKTNGEPRPSKQGACEGNLFGPSQNARAEREEDQPGRRARLPQAPRARNEGSNGPEKPSPRGRRGKQKKRKNKLPKRGLIILRTLTVNNIIINTSINPQVNMSHSISWGKSCTIKPRLKDFEGNFIGFCHV